MGNHQIDTFTLLSYILSSNLTNLCSIFILVPLLLSAYIVALGNVVCVCVCIEPTKNENPVVAAATAAAIVDFDVAVNRFCSLLYLIIIFPLLFLSQNALSHIHIWWHRQTQTPHTHVFVYSTYYAPSFDVIWSITNLMLMLMMMMMAFVENFHSTLCKKKLMKTFFPLMLVQ